MTDEKREVSIPPDAEHADRLLLAELLSERGDSMWDTARVAREGDQ